MSTKILVVDDSMTARRFVVAALAPTGFEVVEAANGLEALEVLDDDIACVLCDVNMPSMNGVEFLEALQGQDRVLPPVLMVTTESEADLVRRARGLGAVGWMLKPFKAEMLVATVRKLVERSRARSKCAS